MNAIGVERGLSRLNSVAKVERRFAEARAALATLEKAVLVASHSEIQRDSAILRLIYTFAALWKCCQAVLDEQEGIEVRSANTAIRAVRRLGWLSEDDATAARNVGRDRNLAMQMYRRQLGVEIEERLIGHAAALRCWLDALQQHVAPGD